MKEAADRMKMKELQKREVLNYAGKLSAFMAAKKKKAILEADILRNNKEIQYCGYRIEEVQRRLDQKNEAIRELEPRIADSKERLDQLRREKGPIEEEYKRLLEIEKNLKEKKAEIEEKKTRIAALAEDIRKGTEGLNRLKDRNQQALARKKELAGGLARNRSKVSRLEEEIGVMATTRDMISGKMPDSIDIQEFPSLTGDKKNIEDYVAEVQEIIRKTSNEITALHAGIEESRTRESALSREKEALQEKLADLEPRLGKDADKESLKKEADRLSRQRESLIGEIDESSREIERLDTDIGGFEKRLKAESELQNDYRERLEYLHKRKQEMSAFEDIETEMERLRDRIHRFHVDTRGNRKVLDLVKEITADLAPMEMALDNAVKEFDAIFNKFKHILILSGLKT